MKKITTLLVALAFCGFGFAQKSKVVAAYNYDKAFARSGKCEELTKGLDAIQAAKESETTQSWSKTWYYSGNLWFNYVVSDKCSSDKAVSEALASYKKALSLNFKDPSKKNADLNTKEGIDKFFAMMQAKEKMENASYTTDILTKRLPSLNASASNSGVNNFQTKDYESARKNFSLAVEVAALMGVSDTLNMYNQALANEYLKDYDGAVVLYRELMAAGYSNGGKPHVLYSTLSKILKTQGKDEEAVKCLAEGRAKYPKDEALLMAEIDHYLQSGNNEGALKNLDQAIEKDASNAVLYFAKGTVLENLKKNDAAVLAYQKAIDIKPDYYDALFNMGAYYFNAGAEKINKANQLPLNAKKEYDNMVAASKTDFSAAIPFVEKAMSSREDDVDSANMLIKLYNRTGQKDKAKALKAKFN